MGGVLLVPCLELLEERRAGVALGLQTNNLHAVSAEVSDRLELFRRDVDDAITVRAGVGISLFGDNPVEGYGRVALRLHAGGAAFVGCIFCQGLSFATSDGS